MNARLFDKLHTLGFKTKYLVSIGVFNDYPVKLLFSEENAPLQNCIVTFATVGYNADQLSSILPSNTSNRNIVFLHAKGEAASFSFDITGLKQEELANTIEATLKTMTELLKQFRITPETKCCVCRDTDIDDYAIWQDKINPQNVLTRPAHVSCLRKASQNPKVIKKPKSNIAMPIFIAFLGALVGIIPTALILLIFEYEVAVLYVLVPITAFYGWKLGGGEYTTTAAAITTLISLLMPSVVLGFILNVNEFEGCASLLVIPILAFRIDLFWFAYISILAGEYYLWTHLNMFENAYPWAQVKSSDSVTISDEILLLRRESIYDETATPPLQQRMPDESQS